MASVNVDIQYLDTVNWREDSECKYDTVDEVDVWRININHNLQYINQFSSLLNSSETARANRYRQQKDKQRFIVSRAALRVILSRYLDIPATAIEFEIGADKKPFIKTGSKNIQYNISHSNDWAVIAISKSKVGVDTEKIDTDFSYQEILQDNFSVEEVSYINQNPSAESFYLLWTRKEAICKLTGQGLDERIKSIPSLNDKHLSDSEIITSTQPISVISFKLDDINLATLATESNNLQTRFWDPDFGDQLI